jgi:two-component system cell cycle sensor histidine kinase/response regulator CckA
MTPLRLLLVEDNEDDAALIVRTIEQAGTAVASRRVETAAQLRDAFGDGSWDAIVCDYTLPQLDAPSALRIAQGVGFDGPFIVVSGAVDEEMTVAAMRAGAHDYVMKGNLRRLPPALERELGEAKLRSDERESRRRLGVSEELFRRVVRQLPGFVWTTDRNLRVGLSLGGARLTAGLPHAEITGRTIADLGDSVSLFDAAEHGRALAGEHVAYEASWAQRDYLVHVEPLLDERGTSAGCIAVALDLTERRAAEQALRESEARFRALIESSLDVTSILAADGSLRYASPSWERVLGYSPEEVHGTSAFDYVHPDDAPLLSEVFAQGSRVAGTTATNEFRVRHKDGSWHVMEGTGLNLLADPAVRGVVVTGRDITFRRALETRVRQVERLEAVGQLAGGIAHDFNNVLLVIRGYSSVLSATLADPKQVADVEEITKATDRAAGLTRQLLAFGRRQVLQPRVLSVGDVVRDIEPLLRHTLRRDIELSLDIAEDASTVLTDPTEIEQVLVNLAVNARDAIEGVGTVTISVREAELAESDANISPPLPRGRYVALTVSDTGRGIGEDDLPHVFEPFFTTKDKGLGTGLGLSTVYGIVAQSNGGIEIRTDAWTGTAVTVYLPVVAGDVDESRPGDGPEVELERGSETILVVEDEAPVRELVRRVLESAGYRVLSASRPSEAEQLLWEAPVVHLLLTDVVMPEMSGYELAATICARRPEIRTLFISGYAAGAGNRPTPAPGELLKKPFAPDELAQAVRRVLDGPRQVTLS